MPRAKAKASPKVETFYDNVRVNQVLFINIELDLLSFSLETAVNSIFTEELNKIIQLNLSSKTIVKGHEISDLVIYVEKDKEPSYEMVVCLPNELDKINIPEVVRGTKITVEGWN